MNLRVVLSFAVVMNIILAGLLLKARSAAREAEAHPAPDRMVFTNTSAAKFVRLDWRSVESADYRAYVQNLRAIGCPEETVFDIIVADVNTLYALRSRSLETTNRWRYWETASMLPSREQLRTQKLRRELEKEKLALIREILGPDAIEKLRKYQLWGDEEIADRKLAFLPEKQRAALKQIQEKFFELQQTATDYDSRGVLTETAAMKITELEQQQRKEIEALLSAEELAEYDLRNSDTAEHLRADLNGFHPTEEEFRRLYQLRTETEATLNASPDVRDPTAFQARNEAMQNLETQAAQSLGATRYAEFQRAQDLDYQNVLRLTQYFSLGDGVAAQVYELKQQEDAQAKALLAASPPPDQIDMAYARMQIEAEAALVKLLGPRAFEEYRRNNRWWLRNQ